MILRFYLIPRAAQSLPPTGPVLAAVNLEL